jgi:hypothetical protein
MVCTYLLVSPRIFAQSDGLMMPMPDPDYYMNPSQKKHMSNERSAEEIQTFYIEQIFSEAFSMEKSSLLTEEERKEIGFTVDTSVVDGIMKKEFAKILAKRDILKLKEKLLGQKENGASRKQKFN